ncbi:MAG: Hsp20/alpha crystallin family protein [Methanomassiliicoccales archaeon PtaU1.Bin124]|nr:MAG: Hsp20/alpha crystallin family protein [Methanomassiliicoccales archaeon PtaU1.Bin124]
MVVRKEGNELVPGIYWGPFAMLDEMDRMFKERTIDLNKMWWPGLTAFDHRVPAIDLKETENGYVLQADLPGMSKEDITLEIGEGALEITAKKESGEDVEEEGYIRKERGTMYYHRRLVLPEDIDPDAIKAKMTDGVLEIDLPKIRKEEPQKKKVDVE